MDLWHQPAITTSIFGMDRVGIANRHVAVAIALFLVPSVAKADIFTYTDAQGVVHYTNRPTRRGKRIIRSRSGPRTRRAGARQKGPRPDVSSRYKTFAHLVRHAAQFYNLPEAFLRAVIRVESGFNPEVISPAGAQGLMQLMPRTAARMGVHNAFDPRQNILGGARYLRMLANTFRGDLVLTVAAYNAGEGAVVKHRGVPPYAETQRYVRKVLRWYYHYRQQGS